MNTRLHTKPWILGVCLSISAALTGCAADYDNPLLGRWLLQREGVAATMPHKLEWEFTKDQVIVRILRPSGEVQEASRSRYTIDPAKTPKWITVTLDGEKPEVRQGVYRIVGGELHLKQTIGGGARPQDFGADDYSVLKREGQPGSPANGSQPIRPETNSPPSAAGSRR